MKEENELSLAELLYTVMVEKYNERSMHMSYNNIIYVWKEIANRYSSVFNGSLELNSANKRKLYHKLYNDASYELLNMLIGQLHKNLTMVEEVERPFYKYTIDNVDKYFYKNSTILIDKMHEEYIRDLAYLNNTVIDLPKMTKAEVISIVKDILDEVDINHEWRKIYEEALNNEKIFYTNELTKEEIYKIVGVNNIDRLESSCTVYNSETGEIICVLLDYTGTIMDVHVTMHEVVHYINRYLDKGKINPILKELPSMYYEIYALNYLTRQGYDKMDIDYIRNKRYESVTREYQDLDDVLYYYELYKKDGYISGNNDLGTWYSYKKEKDRKKGAIDSLIANKYLLFSLYPYILGAYYANKGMELNNDDKTIGIIMKYITENLSRIDTDNVFNILDYPYIKDSTKQKVRKL